MNKNQSIGLGEIEKEVEIYEKERTWEYRELFYNLWLNRYKVEGITEEEHNIIFKYFYKTGTIGAFKYGNPEAGGRIFLPWAVDTLNQYLRPYSVRAIPLNSPVGIPKEPQVCDKDCAIGYALKSMNSICSFVDRKIPQIVGVDMILKIHEFLQKTPLLIRMDSNSREKMNLLIKKVWNNIPFLAINGNEAENIEALINGAPYIIDKLYKYRSERIAEVYTFFGIDNNGIEKAERINMDETNANNAIINLQGYSLDRSVRDFFERAGKVLNTEFKVESAIDVVRSVHEDIRESEVKDDEQA